MTPRDQIQERAASTDDMAQGERAFNFYCSGLMPVYTAAGVEMRRVDHFDFDNMLRMPEHRENEMLLTTIDGTHHIVKTSA